MDVKIAKPRDKSHKNATPPFLHPIYERERKEKLVAWVIHGWGVLGGSAREEKKIKKNI